MVEVPEPHFTPRTLGFLSDLAKNNDKAWFDEHRARYEADVRDAAFEFIEDMGMRLPEIAPHLTAQAKSVGGSLFRIHRDTRFAKDKTPYKTNTGVHFRHERAKDVHAPGLYLHVEPGSCFMGAGIWRPETAVQYAIREQIVERPDAWSAALGAAADAGLTLAGDSLVRTPKGIDPEHPLLDDLKRKDFILTVDLRDDEVTDGGFLDVFTARAVAVAPFMRFVCASIGVPY